MAYELKALIFPEDLSSVLGTQVRQLTIPARARVRAHTHTNKLVFFFF